jgi:hypothetical protein
MAASGRCTKRRLRKSRPSAKEDDRHGREHESGQAALALNTLQGVHAHGHDDGAIELAVALERHGHEVEADGAIRVGDELAPRHRLLAEGQCTGRWR